MKKEEKKNKPKGTTKRKISNEEKGARSKTRLRGNQDQRKHGESDQNHNFGGPNVKQNISINTNKQDFKDIQ